ncbi:hypothetical protein J0H58_21705 [bacterium]|nr:hypothetical protein [bacterium]
MVVPKLIGGRVVKLALTGVGLDRIPAGVKEFVDLEELDLRANSIAIIPSFLAELKKITSPVDIEK